MTTRMKEADSIKKGKICNRKGSRFNRRKNDNKKKELNDYIK